MRETRVCLRAQGIVPPPRERAPGRSRWWTVSQSGAVSVDRLSRGRGWSRREPRAWLRLLSACPRGCKCSARRGWCPASFGKPMSNGSVFGVCVGRVLFGVRILAGGGGQGPRSGSAEGFEPAVGRPVHLRSCPSVSRHSRRWRWACDRARAAAGPLRWGRVPAGLVGPTGLLGLCGSVRVRPL